jgi:hypothetical protein
MNNARIPTAKPDCEASVPACATERESHPTEPQRKGETPEPGVTAAGEPSALPNGLRAAAKLSLAAVCGLTFAFTVYIFFLSMLSAEFAGSRDFASYWATGQQIAHHGNPYDRDALVRIGRAAGLSGMQQFLHLRYPPWTLPLFYPLGFFGMHAASIAWSLLLLVCLLGSVHMLWVMHGRPRKRRYLLGYTFGPALICLIMGQTTILALLGLVLFLRLHRTRPFLAGVSLWLCALKPHLFLPFGVVLLAWVVVSRSYKVLMGAAVAIAVSCAVAFLMIPMEWSQYALMLRRQESDFEFAACLSVLLRFWIDKSAVWLQYLPSALGCIWGLGYFWPRRFKWDWTKDGSVLMLVSLIVPPHTFLYDQVLAIPALLQGASVTRSYSKLTALALLSALVECGLIGLLWSSSSLYVWTLWSAPAWLAWYLWAAGNKGTQEAGIGGRIAIAD